MDYIYQTDIKSVTFRNVLLGFANFREARILKVDFEDADLSDANFSEATLEHSNFVGARYNNNTIWSRDFNPTVAGAILVSKISGKIPDQVYKARSLTRIDLFNL